MPKRAILFAGLTVGLIGSWIFVVRMARPGAADRSVPSYPLSAGLPNDPVLARIMHKTDVVDALVRGELSLDEAAARFRELNGSDLTVESEFRRLYPQASDDELTYRQVLHFAYAGSRWPAAKRLPRLRQLESEFHTRFPAAAPIPEWARVGAPSSGPRSPMIRTLPVPVE